MPALYIKSNSHKEISEVAAGSNKKNILSQSEYSFSLMDFMSQAKLDRILEHFGF